MEPISVAAAVVALLVPYLRHMGDRAADNMGDALGEAAMVKLAGLYRQVKARMASQPVAARALEDLEQRPSDDHCRVVFQGALADLMRSEPAFARALRRLVDDSARVGSPALARIADSGAVTLRGDITIRGQNVAGRDLTIRQPVTLNDR
jgi:hypothetical protein